MGRNVPLDENESAALRKQIANRAAAWFKYGHRLRRFDFDDHRCQSRSVRSEVWVEL
jgi:hypothetical protein